MKRNMKKIVMLSLIVSMVAGSILSVSASNKQSTKILVQGSGNLLYNGSFEVESEIAEPSATDEAAPLMEGWQSKSVKQTQFSLASDAYDGKKSLRVKFSSSDGGSFVLLPSVCDENGMVSGLEPGVYSLSFYAKGSEGATMGVRSKDAGVDEAPDNQIYLGATWKKLTVDNLLVDDTGSIKLEIFGESTMSGLLFMDSFSFSRCPGIDNGDFELDEYVKRDTGNEEETLENPNADYVYALENNVLSGSNAGFENSTEVTNTNEMSWPVITEGWTTGWSTNSNKWSLYTDDTHSGTKALKLTQSKASDPTTLYPDYQLIKDTAPTGRMQLEANTEYMISYWAKGTAQARIRADVYEVNEGVSHTKNYAKHTTNWIQLSDEWTLITLKVTTNSLGEMKWYLWFQAANADEYVIVDDVAVQKVADATDSVEAMIDRFDTAGADAARAKADIEQWCAAIGSENISNYADFVSKTTSNQYLTQGNVLSGSNASFESSTEVTNTNAISWPVITENWTTGWSTNSNKWSLYTDDTHSGTKALKLTQSKASDPTTLYPDYQLIKDTAPTGRMQLEANTEYMISYWAKGTAQARIRADVYEVNEGVSHTKNYAKHITDWIQLSDEWTLLTLKVTTNSLGEVKWYLYFQATNADEYAIIDDVAVQKVADATDSVEAMIDRFDTAGADAARAKADIEQWCAAIGSENISNYSTFESKLANQMPGGEVQNEEIPYWDVSNGSVVSLQEEAVSGEKALKATFSSKGSVAITTKDRPFAFGSGYYTLSFWTKGTGNIEVTAKAYSATNEVTILEQEVNLSDTWKETVIQGIDVPDGYRLKSLSFTLSAEVAGEILLDAIQMYKQLGPGSALDDIVVENRGDVLFLDGAPEGYAVSIYSTSDKSVLGMDGAITTPEYDTSVEYSYVIVNKNDANDKAVSQKYALRVAGTYGVDTGFHKQTVTDKATGISATGLMKDNATISVRSLDAGSEYHAMALKDGYNSIGCYDVYLIPESAYSGAVTVSFKIDSSYNGKAVTVVQVNKDTGKVTELTGVVANGVLSVETLEDGVFMLQLQSTQTVPDGAGGSDTNTNPSNKDSLTNGSNGGSTDAPADTNQPSDMDTQTDNDSDAPADTQDDSNGDDTDQTSGTSRQNNKKLLILIVVIGMALILIALAITATILILGKNDDKSEQNVIEES